MKSKFCQFYSASVKTVKVVLNAALQIKEQKSQGHFDFTKIKYQLNGELFIQMLSPDEYFNVLKLQNGIDCTKDEVLLKLLNYYIFFTINCKYTE